MKKIVCALILTVLFIQCNAASLNGKTVVYIDSYHEGYAWSDGITNGVKQTLENAGIQVLIHRMDTKRNPSDDFKKQAALKAKAFIESSKPDAVIVSDDNAAKFLLMPYFKNASLPFVFCGLNWDASIYNLPYSNATGMVEVGLYKQLADQLLKQTKGKRVGFLSANNLTARKEGEYSMKIGGMKYAAEEYATNFEAWKRKFVDIQNQVDVLIFENNAGIEGWNNEEAAQFALDNTKIPTGSIYDWMMPYVILGYTKSATEQGQAAAKMVVEILGGKKPSDIPIIQNKLADIMINVKLGAKAGCAFPPAFLKNAKITK